MSTYTTMNTDTDDAELERLAEQRAEIETTLEERTDELEQIGEFGTAICTDFTYNDDSGVVVFEYRHPDGSTGQKQFRLSTGSKSYKKFRNQFGADSPTDMLGTKHDCIYTDSGWVLAESPNVRKWTYISHAFENGRLERFYWPPVAIVLASWAVAIALGDEGIAAFSIILTALVTPWLIYKADNVETGG